MSGELPVLVPSCRSAYNVSALPTTVSLSAKPTPSWGVTTWEWVLSSVPSGSSANVGTNGSFVGGMATVEAPTFTADLAGIYVLTSRAANLYGWGEPLEVRVEVAVDSTDDTVARAAAAVAQATAAAAALVAATAPSTTAPLTGGGSAAAGGPLGIVQATAGTDGYLRAVDFVTFAAKMTNVMTQLGDLIYGGASGTPTRLGVGVAGTVLKGDGSTPSWGTLAEADLTLSNVTTNNASTTQHGFLPRFPNSGTAYLRDDGAWATPSGSTNAYTAVGYNIGGGGGSFTVTHNFHAYPVVQCVDVSGTLVVPDSVVHNTTDDFTVSFSTSAKGTCVATLGSPQAQSYVATAVDRNVLVTDHIVKVTAAGKTCHLPTAVGNTGREFVIDNGAGGDVYVDCIVGGQLIEGEATQTVPNNCAMRVYSDGVGYRIS